MRISFLKRNHTNSGSRAAVGSTFCAGETPRELNRPRRMFRNSSTSSIALPSQVRQSPGNTEQRQTAASTPCLLTRQSTGATSAALLKASTSSSLIRPALWTRTPISSRIPVGNRILLTDPNKKEGCQSQPSFLFIYVKD